MSLRLLKLVFRVGKILAVAPSYHDIKNQTFPSKIYGCLMASLLTFGVGVSVAFRAADYAKFFTMKLIVQVLLDGTLYVLNIYSILKIPYKKFHWNKLIKSIEKFDNNNHVKEKSKYGSFVLANGVFFFYQLYMTCLLSRTIGIKFYKQFAIEYLQLYDQFVINFLLYVFLTMLITRQKCLRQKFETQIGLAKNSTVAQFDTIKHDVCLLKEISEIINDIFGWPLFLTIAFTTLQMIMYLQLLAIIPYLQLPYLICLASVILWQCVSSFPLLTIVAKINF